MAFSTAIPERIVEIRDTSNGHFEFIRNLLSYIFCGMFCSILVLALFMAIPITNIVIGALYKDDCPKEKMIPIYLIVAGSVGILKALVTIADMIHKQRSDGSEEEYERPFCLSCIDGPISFFLVVWFIAGCVWIFRTHGNYQSDNPLASDYCHETLFLYSFWSTILAYIVMAVALLVPCIFGCIACCMEGYTLSLL